MSSADTDPPSTPIPPALPKGLHLLNRRQQELFLQVATLLAEVDLLAHPEEMARIAPLMVKLLEVEHLLLFHWHWGLGKVAGSDWTMLPLFSQECLFPSATHQVLFADDHLLWLKQVDKPASGFTGYGPLLEETGWPQYKEGQEEDKPNFWQRMEQHLYSLFPPWWQLTNPAQLVFLPATWSDAPDEELPSPLPWPGAAYTPPGVTIRSTMVMRLQGGVMQLINGQRGGKLGLRNLCPAIPLRRLLATLPIFGGGFPFQGLVGQGLLTHHRLLELQQHAIRDKLCLEYILEKTGIPRETLTQTLATFYHLPFQPYDPQLSLHPVNEKLNMDYLRRHGWLIVNGQNQEQPIQLMTQPANLSTQQVIRQALPFLTPQLRICLEIDLLRLTGLALPDGHLLRILFDMESEEMAKTETENPPDYTPPRWEPSDPWEIPSWEVHENDVGSVALANRLLLECVRMAAFQVQIFLQNEIGKIHFRGYSRELSAPIAIGAPQFKQLMKRLQVMAEIEDNHAPGTTTSGVISLRLRSSTWQFHLQTSSFPHGAEATLTWLGKPAPPEQASWLPTAVSPFLQKVLNYPGGWFLITGPGRWLPFLTLKEMLRQAPTTLRMHQVGGPMPLIGRHWSKEIQTGETPYASLKPFLTDNPDLLIFGELEDTDMARMALTAVGAGLPVVAMMPAPSVALALRHLDHMLGGMGELSDGLRGVLAVTRLQGLCPHCRYTDPVTHEEWQAWQPALTRLSRSGPVPHSPAAVTRHRAKGCPHCQQTGEDTPFITWEMVEVNEELRACLSHRPSLADLEEALMGTGWVPMARQALEPALSGRCQLEDILRMA